MGNIADIEVGNMAKEYFFHGQKRHQFFFSGNVASGTEQILKYNQEQNIPMDSKK